LQGKYIARTLSTEKKYVETTEKNGVKMLFILFILLMSISINVD